MTLSRILKVGAVALAACVTLGGCLVSAPPVRSVSVGYESAGYEEEQPLYHEGYSVHFDTGGLPYVFVGRTARYVPRSHPRYSYYVNHRPHRYERAYPRYTQRENPRARPRHYERY
jgi:hypothetical protein